MQKNQDFGTTTCELGLEINIAVKGIQIQYDYQDTNLSFYWARYIISKY